MTLMANDPETVHDEARYLVEPGVEQDGVLLTTDPV